MKSNKKYVALTFDDGPQETNIRLLKILKEKNAKATFFMIGEKMKQRADIVQQAIIDGHDIGWHTYDHKLNAFAEKPEVDLDIDKAQKIMDEINPDYRISLFRPPAGNITNALVHSADEHGMKVILWSNYSFIDDDNIELSAKERAENTFTAYFGIRDGEVILIHPRDNNDIIEGIGILIDRLKNENYEVVSVSELFKIKNGGIPVYYYFL